MKNVVDLKHGEDRHTDRASPGQAQGKTERDSYTYSEQLVWWVEARKGRSQRSKQCLHPVVARGHPGAAHATWAPEPSLLF